jgi:hypothetical protein
MIPQFPLSLSFRAAARNVTIKDRVAETIG